MAVASPVADLGHHDLMDDERATHASRRRDVLSPRRAAVATMLGGLLWVPYGVLTMLNPWGADVVYSDAKGYSIIIDRVLFLGYSLPGGLALALTSAGLIGMLAQLRTHSRVRGASVLAYAALALGALCLIGVIIMFDPLFTAGRIFGTVALGVATVLAALAVRERRASRRFVAALLLVGAVGLFLLPLWPLVYALRSLAPTHAVWVFVLFGVGWMGVGLHLWRHDHGATAAGV